MSDSRSILSLAFRVVAALVAAAGLVLLFVPGVARGLGRPSEASPWTLTRPASPAVVQRNLLEADGLQVSGRQWRENRQAWSEMNETDRAAMVDRLVELQGLSPEERKVLVERYGTLREKSETERRDLRRQAAELARFENSLSIEDLARLDSLTGRHRAAYLWKLWRTSRGLD